MKQTAFVSASRPTCVPPHRHLQLPWRQPLPKQLPGSCSEDALKIAAAATAGRHDAAGASRRLRLLLLLHVLPVLQAALLVGATTACRLWCRARPRRRQDAVEGRALKAAKVDPPLLQQLLQFSGGQHAVCFRHFRACKGEGASSGRTRVTSPVLP